MKKLILDFTRHAQASKPEGMANTPKLDLYRPLTDMGVQQAIAARARYYGTAQNIKMALHSPAIRAASTVALMLGDGRQTTALIASLPRLWLAFEEIDGPLIWEAFDKYAYDLSSYKNDGVVHAALQRFGKRSADAILQRLSDMNLWIKDGDIWLVGGHAIFHNYTVDALLGGHGVVMSILMGETSCFRVIFDAETRKAEYNSYRS